MRAFKRKLQKPPQTPLNSHLMEDFIKLLKSNVDTFGNIDLTPLTKFNKLECWDSIALLSIIISIKSEYGVGLSNEDILSCSSIEDLYNLTLRKKAEQ